MFPTDVSLDQFSADVLMDNSDTDGMDSLNELLNTNWQTTAAVGLTVASGGVLVVLSVLLHSQHRHWLPLLALVVLAYAGKRRADGQRCPPLPF